MKVAVILPAVVGPECELPCSNDFKDKQGILKLMVGSLPHTI